jgi:hypothetical protein
MPCEEDYLTEADGIVKTFFSAPAQHSSNAAEPIQQGNFFEPICVW